MPPKVISGGDNPYDIHDAKLSSSATAHESSSVTAHEISNMMAVTAISVLAGAYAFFTDKKDIKVSATAAKLGITVDKTKFSDDLVAKILRERRGGSAAAVKNTHMGINFQNALHHRLFLRVEDDHRKIELLVIDLPQ